MTLLIEYKPAQNTETKSFFHKPTPFANKPELDIIKMISDGKLNPHNLKFEERMAVVAVLRYEGLKNYDIGLLLKCSSRTIDRYVHKIKERDTCLVRHVTIEKIGGNLVRLAEQLKARALKKNDEALAWRIECELIDKLQSLGFVYQRPIQIDSKHQEDLNVNVTDQREQQELRDGYRQFLSKN